MNPSPLSWVGTGPFGPEITFMSISQTSSRDVLCGIPNLLTASESQVEPADPLQALRDWVSGGKQVDIARFLPFADTMRLSEKYGLPLVGWARYSDA